MASPYWSALVSKLDPYVPGEQPGGNDLVKLNTNENPYPPSPAVLAALKDAVGDRLRLYPPPESDALRKTIANYYGVSANQVFVGNGSDEVLAHCFHGFFTGKQGELLFPDISYSFYPVYCGLYNIRFRQLPLAENFAVDLAQYPAENAGIIFPNPNAPTGMAMPLSEIESLLKFNTASVVVVDEAYVDFGGESAIALINKYPNLLVIQTLSKSRSLAGLRVGFAIGDSALIEGLQRVKNSFNSYPLDQLAIAGAIASFEDETYFQQTRQQIMASRDALCAGLESRGFTTLPSTANFVFTVHNQRRGSDLAAALRQRQIIVRHFNKPRIEDYLRITVGTDAQHQRLFQALDEILG